MCVEISDFRDRDPENEYLQELGFNGEQWKLQAVIPADDEFLCWHRRISILTVNLACDVGNIKFITVENLFLLSNVV